jgi:hypothetical protein
MMNAIVCEDPSRSLEPGTVVEGANEVAQLKRHHVALLPFDVELPKLAVTGFVLVHFGRGWRFERSVGERGCPMLLHVTNTCRFVYWAARLEVIKPGEQWSAKMRLVHSPDNQRGLGRGMSQVEFVNQTPKFDERGGATVYGKSRFDVTTDGLLFTDLYVVGNNVRVKWSALSQHTEDYRWSEAG